MLSSSFSFLFFCSYFPLMNSACSTFESIQAIVGYSPAQGTAGDKPAVMLGLAQVAMHVLLTFLAAADMNDTSCCSQRSSNLPVPPLVVHAKKCRWITRPMLHLGKMSVTWVLIGSCCTSWVILFGGCSGGK